MVVNVPTDGQEPVTAVLCSGGLDSAVLIAHEALRANVQPVYVNVGFTWEPQELATMWASAGVVDVEVEMETLRASRRLSSQHLGRWFNPGGEKHRTFASFLRRHLDDAELKRVRYYFEEVLLNRDVQWSTTYAYVRGKAAD